MSLAGVGAFGIFMGLIGGQHDEVVLGEIMVVVGLAYAFVMALVRDWRVNERVTRGPRR